MKIRFAVTPPGLAFHESVLPDYVSACGITTTRFPSMQRSLRGWSIPVGVLDELAFTAWKARPFPTPTSRRR